MSSNNKGFIRNSKGFTLLEILIVVTLISVLIAVAAVSYSQAQRRARNAQRQADLQKLSLALEEYYTDNRQYPNVSSSNLIICLAGNNPAVTGCLGSNIYLTSNPRDPLDNSVYTYTPRDDSTFSGVDYQGYDLAASFEGSTPEGFDPLKSPTH